MAQFINAREDLVKEAIDGEVERTSTAPTESPPERHPGKDREPHSP